MALSLSLSLSLSIYIYIYIYNEINTIIIINNKQRIGEVNRKIFFNAREETQRGYWFDRM